MKVILLFVGVLMVCLVNAQTNIFPSSGATGIGTVTPDSSSLLEVKSIKKGILIPRLTLSQRNTINKPAMGLLIYQTNNYPGFYYYDGANWNVVGYWQKNDTSVFLNSGNVAIGKLSPNYKLDVNGDINMSSSSTFRIGGTQILKYYPTNKNLVIGTNNSTLTIGEYTLPSKDGVNGQVLTTNGAGHVNWSTIKSSGANRSLSNLTSTAINTDLLPKALSVVNIGSINKPWNNIYIDGSIYINGVRVIADSTHIGNLALGSNALTSIIPGDSTTDSGKYNTAVGDNSLFSDSTGAYNTATGYESLQSNIDGLGNVANGYQALNSNIHGHFNTAVGDQALYKNTSGYENVALGTAALETNTYGYWNTAVGKNTLVANTIGNSNTACGYSAVYFNTTGIANSGTGFESIFYNTTGNGNTADGYYSLYSNITGNNNTALGYYANRYAIDLNNTTVIGYDALATASNQVRIGNEDITSIGGYVSWSNISDGRVKRNVKMNVPGLVFINKLNPITYNLDLDAADRIIQTTTLKDKNGKSIQPSQEEIAARKAKQHFVYTGFVAQDVEKVAKEIGYDFSGIDAPKNDKDLYGLRYAEFVVPLVKAVQELSKQNDSLKNQNADLENKFEKQQQEIDELKSMITSSASVQQSTIISSASLLQNVPNPFSNSTTIAYYLPLSYSSAKIIITDRKGVVIKQVNLNTKGNGSLTVDASTLASGAYQYSLYVNGKLIDRKQMILAK